MQFLTQPHRSGASTHLIRNMLKTKLLILPANLFFPHSPHFSKRQLQPSICSDQESESLDSSLPNLESSLSSSCWLSVQQLSRIPPLLVPTWVPVIFISCLDHCRCLQISPPISSLVSTAIPSPSLIFFQPSRHCGPYIYNLRQLVS